MFGVCSQNVKLQCSALVLVSWLTKLKICGLLLVCSVWLNMIVLGVGFPPVTEESPVLLMTTVPSDCCWLLRVTYKLAFILHYICSVNLGHGLQCLIDLLISVLKILVLLLASSILTSRLWCWCCRWICDLGFGVIVSNNCIMALALIWMTSVITRFQSF